MKKTRSIQLIVGIALLIISLAEPILFNLSATHSVTISILVLIIDIAYAVYVFAEALTA